ncbi:hypothetical protein BCR36DRAFT_583814 [Piromyces finnis]|uniref:Coth-domain-containing protein n=1 Tax=Piromyces finnis TaxID=1754191 RepID=A0A1Y1V8M4_9FUNG|nr:hypothetical protein BCR36DRAFT_583814 [Piromyces finnis]|eukprot:ORX49761.1 hypothetical protein BCR36DRAFT_583814 [Piromyces finnis]
MTYEVDGKKEVFKKVNFKTGGNYGRANDKIGFNLKLNDNDLLFNRKQLRLRPDASDTIHMRSKLAYDLINNWGLPSVQEAYCEFYLNGEYFGLYFLQDTIKGDWVRKTYGLPADEEVDTLYYCRKDGVNLVKGDNCYNQNDKAANYTEPFEEFLEKVENATSVEDLEKFMNVDLLMKNLAIEFLFGSFDHFVIQGHNFFMYQRKDGIWDMILVDFDAEFGSALYIYTVFVLNYHTPELGYELKFEDMPKPGKKILDVAYFKDKSYFKKALRELMVTGFNPDNTFKRIDELKEFIDPYVKKSLTLRADGRLPGVINFKGQDNTHTYEDFQNHFSIEPENPVVPSLKGWIKHRFEFACKEYGFDPEEILKEAAAFRGEEYIPKETTTSIVEEETEKPTITRTIIYTTTVVTETIEVTVSADEDEDSADEIEVTASADEVEDSADEVEDSADEE